jgi:DNA-nicking Smr family endonuclease
LREKAKKITEKMDKKKKDAANKMLDHKNKGRDANEIDLHGLQAKAAVEATEKFLANKKVDKSKPGIVITGKGSHSGPDGPKITAAVEQYLKDKKIKYDGPVDGTFTIHFAK